MNTHTDELRRYEDRVDAVIADVILPYQKQLTLRKEDTEFGQSWKIIPRNPNAARIEVYGVDDVTVNVSVDDMFWLELFVDTQAWDNDLQQLQTQLRAIMDGKAIGWYDTAALHDKLGGKTLLEVAVDEDKPFRWSGNMLFTGLFKRSKRVTQKQYEPY